MIKEKRISKALIPGTTTVGEGAPAFDLMRGREGTCCCRRQGIEQMVCLGDALQGDRTWRGCAT